MSDADARAIIHVMPNLELELISRDERIWLDFIVEGKSLYSLIYPDYPEQYGVSCLTLLYQGEELQKMLDSLLLRGPAEFPNNRRALYVCAMCGDLACGALSAVIEEDENTIIWRDFGWENTYEDNVERLEGIEPFVFDRTQYIGAFKDSLNLLNQGIWTIPQ